MSLKLKCIELYLQLKQGANLEEIREDLDVPFLELYPLLEVLERQEQIEYHEQRQEFILTE